MNSKICTRIIALTLFAALAVSLQLAAQTSAKPHHPHQYHHYRLVDPGTFGGANSSQFYPNPKGNLNNRGVAVGAADTSIPDPTSTCFNGDCYICYGFKWEDGVLHKLDALPGFNSSATTAVSNSGHVVGLSEHGFDPLTGGRAFAAVSWGKDGSITDLGSFGGNEGGAFAVNNRGVVVGAALNTIADPYAGFFGIPAGATQSHAFRWTKSAGLQDLGTLGGADSVAVHINDRGQILGYSFTDSTVNPVTGFPTTHPFLWENGTMTDLGTLGGSFAGPGGFGESVGGLNNRGDVIGTSNLAGDGIAHPFLWTKSGGMQDLGILPGGTFGFATWVNDAREVVGLSTTSDALHAFFWRNGVMTDLGTVGTDPNSQANSINSRGQVVGASFDTNDLHGFLWEDGGPIVDLNTLVSPGSSVFVPSAIGINDRGEIVANGVLPNGDQHTVLLIPCDENHPDIEGCDYSMVDAATAAQSAPPRYVPNGTQPLPQSRRGIRYRMSGRVAEGGAAVLTVPASTEPDFTRPHIFFVSLTALTPSTVNAGGSSTSDVTVGITGLPAAAGTAALACTVQPSPPLAPTCSISPASLSFPGTPATLTVNTVGPNGALRSHGGPSLLYALWLPLIGLIATGAGLGSDPNRRKGKLKKAALACALFAGLTFPLACGSGGGSSQRTPPGTYTINVTATAFIPVNSSIAATPLTVQ